METKKIVIGSDHGGLHLKASIINHLEKRGFSVTDVGTLHRGFLQLPGLRGRPLPSDSVRRI